MKSLLFFCCFFVYALASGQGIISHTPGKLRTVPATGSLSSPLVPKFGINLDPTTNLDVEGVPEEGLLSNIRFRNLPPTMDTMVLVRNRDGFVTWRGASTLGGGSAAGAGWLLTGNTVSGTDFIGTLHNDDMRFRSNNAKRMRLLSAGSLSIEAPAGSNTADDIANILVGDGNNISTGNSNIVGGWSNRLTNTAACIVAGMQNQSANPSGALLSKSVMLGWGNTIKDHNEYIIGAANTANREYSGAFGVGLSVTQEGCWYLGGNTGTSLINNLGNSLAIGWAGTHTGLFDANGLTLGTGVGNTTGAIDQATARIDVNGQPFNLFPSGVRFRDLPDGAGDVLVIDPAGYVYKTRTRLGSDADNGTLKAEVQDLKAQLAQLQQQVQNLQGSSAASKLNMTGNNSLSIVPTPFHDRATVAYAIDNFKGNAVLRVTDSKGVLLKAVPLTQAKGQVEVNQLTTTGGMLVFSILVDGQMVVSKQSVSM
jgi:hypothetical protein